MTIRYTEPDADVPPGVDFLDAAEAREWVLSCEVDKPWRDPLWQMSLCMTVDEQFDALGSAGFTDITLADEIGAIVFLTGRA